MAPEKVPFHPFSLKSGEIQCQYFGNSPTRSQCLALALRGCACVCCGNLCAACLALPCPWTGGLHILWDTHPDPADTYSRPESDVRRWN
jgi:hypothetical protein